MPSNVTHYANNKQQTESEVNIYIAKLDKFFRMMPNQTAEDPNLSFGAKGLLLYLLSRKPDWELKTSQLAKVYRGGSRGNGIESVKGFLRELKKEKYITYEKFRDEKGQWVHSYKVYSLPYPKYKIMFPEEFESSVDESPTAKAAAVTRKDLIRNKHKQLLRTTTTTRESHESPSSVGLQKKVVVVPLFLSEIPGLSDAEAYRLIDLFGEDRIKAKLPVLEAAPGVEVPFGFLRKAVEENWQVRQTPEDRVPENRKWAKSVLDGRFIGPVRVEALNTRLEFIYEGQREPDCFEYGLANFKDVVGAHYRSVQARLKGV